MLKNKVSGTSVGLRAGATDAVVLPIRRVYGGCVAHTGTVSMGTADSRYSSSCLSVRVPVQNIQPASKDSPVQNVQKIFSQVRIVQYKMFRKYSVK